MDTIKDEDNQKILSLQCDIPSGLFQVRYENYGYLVILPIACFFTMNINLSEFLVFLDLL